MKNNISSSSDNNKISLLPKDVQAILQSSMTEEYKDVYLNISSKLANCFIIFDIQLALTLVPAR